MQAQDYDGFSVFLRMACRRTGRAGNHAAGITAGKWLCSYVLAPQAPAQNSEEELRSGAEKKDGKSKIFFLQAHLG